MSVTEGAPAEALVGPAEREIIERALRFANVQRIRQTAQVERIFRTSVFSASPFKVLPDPADVKTYREHDQREIRRWLQAISEQGRYARGAIGGEVTRRLGTVQSRSTTTFDGTRVVTVVTIALDGVQAWYSYAVAMLLDARLGLTTRLGRCGICGRFRITWRGKPTQHCPEHRKAARLAAAAKRQEKYRQHHSARTSARRPLACQDEQRAGTITGKVISCFPRLPDETR